MKYCSRCLYPENAKPTIIIDEEDGLCSGCRYHESRAKIDVNWDERRKMFEQILEEAKNVPIVNPNNCAYCHKKLNLLYFKCRCESYFCSKHRQPEEHSCTFDFKSVGIRKLSEENPLVQGDKFHRL